MVLTNTLLRHDFIIEDLGQAGWLRPHSYRYYCVRCRWTFLIEGRRGEVTALDEVGAPLPEAENARRISTFALGPCCEPFTHRVRSASPTSYQPLQLLKTKR